ncbi:hypothetical protein DFJ74DRAFT_684447 [Hyaloraphidium curvatum]|nr:hypothetical protein DFJ74DRAFT_684447 [Hyaloraphidium curvatum]
MATEAVPDMLQADDGQPGTPAVADAGPPVAFKVAFGKEVHQLSLPGTCSVGDLKKKLEEATGIHANLQKLIWKGTLNDEKLLKDCQLTATSKVLMMASKVSDIVTVNLPPAAGASAEKKPLEALARWETMTEHKKVIEKGPPEDAPAPPSGNLPIPPNGIVGLFNRQGIKTRLTFKPAEQQVVIATADRTQKVSYDQIKNVSSQAISTVRDGKFHILALQLGPTEKSQYFLYWFPAAYVQAVKDAILGEWETFGF